MKKQPEKFRVTFVCSEIALRDWVRDFSKKLGIQSWIFLEGSLGAGKSTLARMILESKGVDLQSQAGSPTFPILFEYSGKHGIKCVHVDLYRLKSEDEIQSAGVEAAFFEQDSIVLCEWASLFPRFQSAIENLDPRMRAGKHAWKILLESDPEGDLSRRQVTVTQLF